MTKKAKPKADVDAVCWKDILTHHDDDAGELKDHTVPCITFGKVKIGKKVVKVYLDISRKEGDIREISTITDIPIGCVVAIAPCQILWDKAKRLNNSSLEDLKQFKEE